MTLKNILPIACFLFAAVSCSMEDELINDIDKAKNTNVSALAGEAALSFKVSVPGRPATKADPDGTLIPLTDAEKAIDHCSLILLDGSNNVIKAYDDVKVNADGMAVFTQNGTDTVKFIVKVGDVKNYRLMAVANSTTNYAASTTLAAIQASVQGKTEYSKTAGADGIVKVGISENIAITSSWSGFPGYETIQAAKDNAPVIVDVKLTQLEARIELAEFNVTGFTAGTLSQHVAITKVELININTVSKTVGEHYEETNCLVTDSKTYTDGLKVYDATNGKTTAANLATYENGAQMPVFYSFRNESTVEANQVAMRIYFDLGKDQKVSRDIIINGGEVKPGYLYRLTVNSSIVNDNIECAIKCYTLDWVYSTFEVEMTE